MRTRARDERGPEPSASGVSAAPRVVILGAGFGGIAVCVSLLRAGFRDVTILEKSDGVGGTWRANTYPGAACDIPSHLYSLSFAPNPEWPRAYGRQPEILAYLEKVADDHGIRPHLRCGAAVEQLRWLDGELQWEVTLAGGETLHADVVVSAVGMLEVPVVPELPGRERFAGPAFHSARWDHSVDVVGKRVAVVGTGASAVQIVPAIVRQGAGGVSLFQRTPSWQLPKPDPKFTAEELQRFRSSRLALLRKRAELWWQFEKLTAFRLDDTAIAEREQMCRRYLEKAVADPELRRALTPDYPFGCKRVLPSSFFYPTVQQPHVSLVPQAVAGLTEAGVVARDGSEHPADVVVWCTGFKAAEFLSGLRVLGRGGVDLHEQWETRGGAEAHLGICVDGFPNLFLMYGPNTNQGGNSIVFMLEAQAHYIAAALKLMRRRRIAALEVTRPALERYNATVAEAMKETVWLGGCQSYYASPSGKITTQLPFPARWYWLRTRLFDVRHFARTRRTLSL